MVYDARNIKLRYQGRKLAKIINDIVPQLKMQGHEVAFSIYPPCSLPMHIFLFLYIANLHWQHTSFGKRKTEFLHEEQGL